MHRLWCDGSGWDGERTAIEAGTLVDLLLCGWRLVCRVADGV